MTHTLIMNYGITALVFAFTALGFLLSKFVYDNIKSKRVRETLERAMTEVEAATLEVANVYVDALKASKEDGLTQDEKDDARDKAIKIAKQNLGRDGLKKLAKIVDAESWMSNRVEAFLGAKKAAVALPKPVA